MRKLAHLIASIITLALLVGASAGGLGLQTLAQSDDTRWTEPVNLSRSAAASKPVLVTGPEGTLQVLWWDQFDGIMTANYGGEEWSAATQASIIMATVVGEGEEAETIYTPLEEMPAIAGGSDYAHALWRGEPDEETGIVPLMHSRLAIGAGGDWSWPRTIGESTLVWRMAAAPDGVLHLIYIRARHSDALPAGVYHMRSTDGGSSWNAPQALYETAYFRLLDPEEAHLWVATGAEGEVYAAWDDPRLERTFLARSLDGGVSWGEAQIIGDPDDSARRARVIPTQGKALLLWEAGRAATGCALYQQRLVTATGATTATQTLTTTWSAPEPALEDLRACPEALTVHRTEEGDPVLIMGGGSGSLTAAAWDGAQWSKPKPLSFSFEHPELGRQVTLEALQTALVDGEFAVVGLGQDGDVWYLESEVKAWEWAFAPPSPWSEPADVSQSGGVPGRPAVAVDTEGRVHLLWSEAPEEGVPGSALYYARRSENRWSRPARVLQSPEGKAEEPALVAVGDRLHALWSGGRSGAIYYSRAYVRDAYAPDGWSEPLPLPAPGDVGSAPAIVADLVGTLHVVYAVPLNEGRGIYYVRSDDRQGSGQAWSEPQVIFDAVAAGWAMADHPTLAMDPSGTLHVAWVRGSRDGPFPPQGIFYARSTDGGQGWSEPRAMAEGAYDWPLVVATPTGQVHLLWGEASGGFGWTHQWSADGGAGWTRPERVGRFAGVRGPVGLATDGAETLHLVGVGEDDAGEPALLYTTWDGSAALTTGDGRWDELETFRLAPGASGEPGVAVALRSALGRLDVTFRGEVEGEEGDPQVDVLYASRSVPAVEVTPVPALTPRPTVTPTPSPMPTPTPTPRPTVPAQTPEPGPPVLDLGPITLPMTALGGLAVAALIVVGVLAGRGLWAGRR